MADLTSAVARRKALTIAVAALLNELGFDNIENMALETLVEMTQSFITALGQNGRSYCELSGRTEPLIGDLVVSLIEMGVRVDGVERHARRNQRLVLPAVGTASQPKQLAILQAGQKLPHPFHIPTHLPSFPDPHAYIRTPTHKQPVTEYEALREKAASQKRDVERALTRFVAKTGDTHSLFLTDDTNLFPLVACQAQSRPYIDALLPRDQIFEEQEEEELEQQQRRRSRKDEIPSGQQSDLGDKSPSSEPSSPLPPETPSPVKLPSANDSIDTDVIDNPYLRPVKVPKRSRVK